MRTSGWRQRRFPQVWETLKAERLIDVNAPAGRQRMTLGKTLPP